MNKKTKKVSGFTLLELLIVIAIIGVLATIIIGSLSSAKNKGTSTAIKQEMKSILTQGALYLNATGSYGSSNSDGLCSTAEASNSMFNASNGNGADTTVKILGKIGQAVGDPNLNDIQKTLCYVQPDSFVVGILLPNGEGVYCIDSRNIEVLHPGATDSPDNYAMRDPTSTYSPQSFICRP